MAEEVKEYLDYDGLVEYDKKSKELFQDLTIQDVEEAFNELDESDPSYSAFYDVIQKAKEATSNADSKAAAAVTATNNANTATSKADEATARANKAAEKLETVNDMTTGINLLRGTMDWRIGTGKDIQTSYADGFLITGSRAESRWSVSEDEEGFGVLSFVKLGGSSGVYAGYASSSRVIVDDVREYTYFGEIRIDSDVSSSSETLAALVTLNSSYGLINAPNLSSNVLGIDLKKRGVWQPFVYHFNLTNNDVASFFVRAQLQQESTISASYRKLDVVKGRVNNPIYSVNPADLALEPVNDITTMPNLLRGTRDFVMGNTRYSESNANFLIDGFAGTGSFTSSKDLEGFTVLSKTVPTSSTAGTYQLFGGFVTDLIPSDVFTFSFDFMVDNVNDWDDRLFATMRYITKDASSKVQMTYTPTTLGLDNVESGVWYRTVGHYVPNVKETGIYICLTLRIAGHGSINFRKPAIYKGRIEHPEWSASPFDVAGVQVENSSPLYLGVLVRSLENGNDINDFLEPGCYRCHSANVAQSLKHCPTQRGFRLFVETMDGLSVPTSTTGYCLQTIIDVTGRVWRRIITSGSFPEFSEMITASGLIPYSAGGTNANSLAGAKTNLGISALEARVAALEAKLV